MKIPDPWCKSEPQQMHQRKNMLRETCRIGVMLRYFKITFVIKKAIKYVGGVTNTADHFGIKRAVLIRNVRIKLYPRFLTVLHVDLTRIAAMAANPKILAIRR